MPTILHRLARWAKADPNSIAQRYKQNKKWHDVTAQEFCDNVYALGLFLESRGVTPADVGAILSYNCPAWIQVDLALGLIQAKSVGFYPNSTSKDIQYILEHTEATVLAVQNKVYFQKLTGKNGENPVPEHIRMILVFDNDTSISPKAVSLEQALTEGRKLAAEAAKAEGKRLKDYLARLDPRAGAFLIYTSGTTGNPKGAILSHDNLAYTVDVIVQHWDLPPAPQQLISFLPLSHIAERLHSIGMSITQRYTVSFCTKLEHISIELPEVEPTLLLAVPRVWEKIMEGVQHKLNRAPKHKKLLVEWGLGVGARIAKAKYAGKFPNPADLIQYPLAQKLVISKVRQALGMSRTEKSASGAAALPAHVSEWFRSIGVEILECFGQTESTGVVYLTQPGVDSLGRVGVVPMTMEARFGEDNEILARGRHIFKGYLKDEKSTAEALDSDGWLHTGDTGEVDLRGLMQIKGRKKEVLKTSGGKMVAPLPIEEQLKTSPIISHACMVGDGRKYFSVLITLTENTLNDYKERNGSIEGDVITAPEILGPVKKQIDAINATLAGFEQIKRYAVLSRDFSLERGEMTPTMKMKRAIIEKNYRHLIDQMYPTEHHD